MLSVTIHRNDGPSYQMAVLELPEREDLLAEKLERIGVGPTLEQNCRIDRLEGDAGALQALVGSSVNADELQYLAKRMESFDKNELLKFRAAVAVEKAADLKDLINLTYNLHCYTVITDFSDLAGIGRTHLLSKLMSVPCDSLTGPHCEAVGRELIAGGGGTITPYGVLYRNGNQPELVYSGRQFPEYFFRECEATLTLSPDEDFKVAETLYLPCFDVEMKKAFLRLGVTEREKCYAKLEANRICEAVQSLFEREFTLTEHLDALNRLARCYMGFDDQTLEKYHAVFDYAWPQTPEEAVCLAENIFDFTVLKDVSTAEQYGRHMVENSGHFESDPYLEDFVDFQSYGQRRVREEHGVFTDRGYLAYRGSAPLVEEILSRTIPLEEQQDQGQQMGGI